MKKKELTASEIGKKGGNSTFRKYGKTHMEELSRTRWEKYYKNKLSENSNQIKKS